MKLNIPEAFAYRVNYAARCLQTKHYGDTGCRGLDNCFENYDGELVVTALVRRSQGNPKLREAIARGWGGVFPQQWIDTAAKWAHVSTRNLSVSARAERERQKNEAAHRLAKGA